MKKGFLKHRRHCRWCSIPYLAANPKYRDGFCTKRCEQALYRAFKKYLTAKTEPVIKAALGRRKK